MAHIGSPGPPSRPEPCTPGSRRGGPRAHGRHGGGDHGALGRRLGLGSSPRSIQRLIKQKNGTDIGMIFRV